MSVVRLWVGNLPYNVTEEDLRKAFDKFQPSTIYIADDRKSTSLLKTEHPQRFGFVTLTNKSNFAAAKNEMNGFILLGQRIVVDYALK